MEWRWVRPADCVRLRQMKGHGSKFGRKKEAAIVALLTQRNIDEAARAINVATNTLLKWMKLPEFQAADLEARRPAHAQSIARLQQATSAAVSTVRAADSVLNHSAKSIELEDLEVRLAALEAAAASGKHRR
jgi:hypothetical protein